MVQMAQLEILGGQTPAWSHPKYYKKTPFVWAVLEVPSFLKLEQVIMETPLLSGLIIFLLWS